MTSLPYNLLFMKNNNIIGILWGMWPYASLRAYRLLLDLSEVYRVWGKNHEFPHIILDNIPVAALIDPDIWPWETISQVRYEYIRLKNAWVNIFLMACNTMHLYSHEIYGRDISSWDMIISLIDEMQDYIRTLWHKKVGLLWSERTLESGLYEVWFLPMGVEIVISSPEKRMRINTIIDTVIAWMAIQKNDIEFLQILIRDYQIAGCESVILGCTELPIACQSIDADIPLLDPLEIALRKVCERYYRE